MNLFKQEKRKQKIQNGGGVSQDKFNKTINKVYNLLFALGVSASVVIGAMLGIKFIIGSIEEQAKIKEILLPYIMGCLVTFGAFGIWKLLMGLLGKL